MGARKLRREWKLSFIRERLLRRLYTRSKLIPEPIKKPAEAAHARLLFVWYLNGLKDDIFVDSSYSIMHEVFRTSYR